jgi:Protein of unknown function (DUF4054)
VTAAEFRAYFPGVFDTTSDTLINLRIAEAELNVNESVWGAKYELGLSYLTAHLLSSVPSAPGNGGAVGPVTSKRIGDVAMSYGAVGSVSTVYDSTSYGQRYEYYKSIVQSGPRCAAYDGSQPLV